MLERILCFNTKTCGSWLASDEASTITATLQTGKLVVDLISDSATIEFTS